MKIVHVITRFILGGADENTMYTCNGQAEAGHEVFLVVGRQWDQTMRDRLDSRVNFVCVDSLVREIEPVRDLRCLVSLSMFYRRVKPDIIHTHESKAGIIGRMASFLAPKSCRVVHGVHIVPFEAESGLKKYLYLYLERVCSFFTHHYISVSAALQRIMIENRVGSSENHSVIPSGMDIFKYRNAIPFSVNELAERTGLSNSDLEGSKILLVSGTLEPRKRVDKLISMVASLNARSVNAVLVVCGGGTCMADLVDLSRKLGVQSQVVFIGYTSELERYIASADVCCHAAEHEGLPRVVIQYVAAQKPVVVSMLPGIEVVVKDGENGFVVESSDFSLFESRVLEILENNNKFNGFVSEVDVPIENWGAEHMVSQINEIYMRLI